MTIPNLICNANINSHLIDLCSQDTEPSLEDILFLIERGVDVQIYYNTPLRACAYRGYLNTMKLLIKHGANLHDVQENALTNSASEGHFSIVQFLIEKGAILKNNHHHAFIASASNGHLDIVKYLIEHGEDSTTPLNQCNSHVLDWLNLYNNRKNLYESLHASTSAFQHISPQNNHIKTVKI